MTKNKIERLVSDNWEEFKLKGTDWLADRIKQLSGATVVECLGTPSSFRIIVDGISTGIYSLRPGRIYSWSYK